MRVLITGAGGQLGRALQRTAPPWASVRVALHKELDIADQKAVQSAVSQLRPEIVLNAAGLTNVDMAEERNEEARRANHLGPRILAETCRHYGAWFVHVSSSYVFDGTQPEPYVTTAQTAPLNVYGMTKLNGELAVRAALPEESTIVRTCWLHSVYGRHFLARMLYLLETKPVVRVVCDQIGTPTSADGLAGTLWALALRRGAGIYHWSDLGMASWYEFALAIAQEGNETGAINATSKIMPVSSEDFAARALRPRNSVLDTSSTETYLGIAARHWRTTLRETLLGIATERRQAERAAAKHRRTANTVD